jgi:hypothetical protein
LLVTAAETVNVVGPSHDVADVGVSGFGMKRGQCQAIRVGVLYTAGGLGGTV